MCFGVTQGVGGAEMCCKLQIRYERKRPDLSRLVCRERKKIYIKD